MSYSLTMERAAQKSLEKISPSHQERVIEAIEALAADPRLPGTVSEHSIRL